MCSAAVDRWVSWNLDRVWPHLPVTQAEKVRTKSRNSKNQLQDMMVGEPDLVQVWLGAGQGHTGLLSNRSTVGAKDGMKSRSFFGTVHLGPSCRYLMLSIRHINITCLFYAFHHLRDTED